MKKLLSILLALILCIGLLISCSNEESSSSQSETDDESSSQGEESNASLSVAELEYTFLSSSSVEVSIGTANYLEEIVIPEEYNGARVMRIAEDGFKNAENLKKISIPDTVTSIGARAFEDCRMLSSVDISRNIAVVGEDAFKGCPIKTASAPSSVLSSLPKSSVEEVNIVGNFIIYEESMKDFEVLSTVTIPDGAVVFEGAFDNCLSLTNVQISKNVKDVEVGAFKNCPLTEVSAPYHALTGLPHDTVKKLTITTTDETGSMFYQFSRFTALEEVTLPEGITSIGRYFSFVNCHTIKCINLPKGLTGIEIRAFENCSSLESVEIPDGVTLINTLAFNGCKSLKTITIPSSVTRMSGYAFVYCESLETINCEATKKPNGWDYNWLNSECTATVNWGYVGD